MKLLFIVGVGGFSTEADEFARLVGYDEIVFLDDNLDATRCEPVVGVLSDIEKMRIAYDTAIVTLRDNEKCMELHRELKR